MASTISAQYGMSLTNAAFLFGLIPCALGINALLRPDSALAILQFPLPSQPEAQKLTRSLMYLYGVRDLALGLATLGVWSTGYRKALGYIMLAGLPIEIVDGLVSRYQIGRGEWNHWALAPIGLGMAAGLLEWI